MPDYSGQFNVDGVRDLLITLDYHVSPLSDLHSGS